MTKRLKDELKQKKPFATPEQEAFLNIVRTAAMLEHETAEALKAFGLTTTQYNVLRILRGAGESGLCRNDVRERLVAQVPDTTRLLDRLVEMGLVVRARDGDDRRYVTTRITPRALDLLEKLDEPIAEAHRRQLGHMSREDLSRLIALLERVRTRG